MSLDLDKSTTDIWYGCCLCSIRNEVEFDDQLLSSASSRTALITLWTASWCPSCKIVTPIIRDLIETQGAGEEAGGVSFAEVEFDSPTIGEVAGRYAITSLPTLMAFSRQEAQLQTRVTDMNEMKDKEFLRRWIADEARRGGKGGQGGGSGFLGGIFGGTNR